MTLKELLKKKGFTLTVEDANFVNGIERLIVDKEKPTILATGICRWKLYFQGGSDSVEFVADYQQMEMIIVCWVAGRKVKYQPDFEELKD